MNLDVGRDEEKEGKQEEGAGGRPAEDHLGAPCVRGNQPWLVKLPTLSPTALFRPWFQIGSLNLVEGEMDGARGSDRVSEQARPGFRTGWFFVSCVSE